MYVRFTNGLIRLSNAYFMKGHIYFAINYALIINSRKEILMIQKKHKHKKSFSVLVISNTGQSNKQFHLSLFSIRLLVFLLLLICATLGWYTYWFLATDRNEAALHEQIASQAQLIQQLEAEKESLNNENLALAAENDSLRHATQVNTEEAEMKLAAESEPESDSSFPSRYPYSESVILIAAYSDEHPYLSINTQAEGNIIAAGDGTITAVTSDDIYPLIIEINHGNGYITRYMCQQNTEPLLEEGSQVQIGDSLVSISIDTQLDYQVTYEEQPIDPLMVLEAKG